MLLLEAANHNFLRTKWGSDNFFLDGKCFLRCREEQHSYTLQFIERLRTVTEAHTPQVKSLFLQDWILARDLLQSIPFSENKNCGTYSGRAASQLGRGKGKRIQGEIVITFVFWVLFFLFTCFSCAKILISNVKQKSRSQMHYISALIIQS